MERETNEKDMATMPVFVHEYDCARLERIIKMLVLVIILLFGYIAYNKYQDSLYDYSDITVDSMDGSNAAYMGDGASGIINNGQSGSQEENKEEKE